MFRNSLKIKVILIFIIALNFAIPRTSFGYRVSGLLDFSYNSRDIKTEGGASAKTTSFSQLYALSLQSYILDRRFLSYNLSASYTMTDFTKSSLEDTSNLNYSAALSFFPQMMVSWDLFGSQTTTEVKDVGATESYDVKSTVYGGTLNLRLKSGNGLRNNNYNNNNSNGNNNGGAGGFFSWFVPNIGLAYTNTERESLNRTNPLDETLEQVNTNLAFSGDDSTMLITAGTDHYENKITKSEYDLLTATLNLQSRVPAGGSLRIDGDVRDADTSKMVGFDAKDTRQRFHALLSFNGQTLSHDYQYDLNVAESSRAKFQSQLVSMNIYKPVSKTLTLKGGLSYNASDFKGKGAAVATVDPVQSSSANMLAGAIYEDRYTPEFLGPFAVTTRYDFSAGSTKVKNLRTDAADSGAFYTNYGSISLDSQGWTYENLGLIYSINAKRDQSPLENDTNQQKIGLRAKSTRIPKTSLEGTVDYTSTETRAKDPTGGYLTVLVPGLFQNGRTMRYSLTADYLVSYNFTLGAGMSRDESKQNLQSLSTLVSAGSSDLFYDQKYVRAQLYWLFTRRLTFNGEARSEWKEFQQQQNELQSNFIDAGLNYLLRQVRISFTYQFRQDNPKNGLSTTEQNYFAKLSRAF